MILKQIWIISENGLQLFSYQVRGNGPPQDGQRRISDFLKASGVYNIISYFNEFLLGEPVDSILTGTHLWVIHYETVVDYVSRREIHYAVISLSQIDLTIPVLPQKEVLTRFCREISLEFYSVCGEEIIAFTNLNLKMFEGFRPQIVKLVQTFEEEIADGLEAKLATWKK